MVRSIWEDQESDPGSTSGTAAVRGPTESERDPALKDTILTFGWS
jgi:hypothetical protein